MSASFRLQLFARPLVAGAVKTRLIPALGAEGALALYAHLLDFVVDIAAATALGPLELCFADEVPGKALCEVAERVGAELVPQGTGDLGARMARALKRAQEEGARPILLGTDLAGLRPAHLLGAAEALAKGAAYALAPAEDGGYGVIAAATCDDTLFHAMPWSTETVFAETVRRLETLGRAWVRLPELFDIDGPEDLPRLRTHPQLSAALKGLGDVSPS